MNSAALDAGVALAAGRALGNTTNGTVGQMSLFEILAYSIPDAGCKSAVLSANMTASNCDYIQPASNPNICVTGDASECPAVQASIEYEVCIAINYGAQVANTKPCTVDFALAFANMYFEKTKESLGAMCGGSPPHVCFQGDPPIVSTSETYDKFLKMATGGGNDISGGGDGIPDVYYDLSETCQAGFQKLMTEGVGGNSGTDSQSGTDTPYELTDAEKLECGLIDENGAPTQAQKTINQLNPESSTGMCNSKGSLDDFGKNCADVPAAIEAKYCEMEPQIAAYLEPYVNALYELVDTEACTEDEVEMVIEYFFGDFDILGEALNSCGGPPHPCFSQKKLRAAKKAAAKELSSGGKLSKYTKKDLIDYLNNTAPFVVPSFTALGLSASVLMA